MPQAPAAGGEIHRQAEEALLSGGRLGRDAGHGGRRTRGRRRGAAGLVDHIIRPGPAGRAGRLGWKLKREFPPRLSITTLRQAGEPPAVAERANGGAGCPSAAELHAYRQLGWEEALDAFGIQEAQSQEDLHPGELQDVDPVLIAQTLPEGDAYLWLRRTVGHLDQLS